MELDRYDFEPRYFHMNGEFHDLIQSGNLKNGMRVLIEDSGFRCDPKLFDFWDEPALRDALQYNRWCEITELRFGKISCSFIGVYDDGTKISWDKSMAFNWYVEKSSIPTEEEDTTEIKRPWYRRIFGL